VLCARVATAQAEELAIPAECGNEAEFRAELEKLTGADAERAQPTRLIIARPSEREEYRLTLELRGEERVLTHADCRVLFRSALVIAAASVRPPTPEAGAVEAGAEPRGEPLPAPAPEPAPPRDQEPDDAAKLAGEEPETSNARRESWKIGGSLSGGAGLALGVLPDASAVLELRAALLVEQFAVSASGKYLPPRSVSAEGRGADIHAFGARGAVGYRPHRLLWISAGLDADLLVGEGTSGIASPDQDSAWTLAPSLELALVPLNTRHLALEIALQGRYAVQRPVFEVTGFKELYQVPPWGMLSVVRGVWLFP
jgi:hypothetical protein